MGRYKGKRDVFFGIEHRLRKEEMEEQFNKEAKEGWIFAGDAGLQMKEQAGRIRGIHQEVYLLQVTATWEHLLERKKEQ